mgnify:CR=1 FL=1
MEVISVSELGLYVRSKERYTFSVEERERYPEFLIPLRILSFSCYLLLLLLPFPDIIFFFFYDYLMLFQTEIIARPIDIATSPSTRRPSSSPRSSRRNSRDFRENAKPIQFLMSLLRNSIGPDSISSVMGAGHSSPRNRATVTAFGVDTMTT